MMRILLTGTSGQVGGALKDSLGAKGEVLSPNRADLDLSRPESLGATLNALSPNLIINPAAYTAVDLAEDDRELAYRINAEAPEVMARWAAGRDVPIVHFSTDYVFNGSGDQPWREDDLTDPLSVYGASKLAGEMAVREAGGSHLIIRTSWVFASEGKNFLKTMAKLAHERPELRIVADQVGAPTSARSIAGALTSILSRVGSKEMDIHLIKRRFSEFDGLVHLSNKGETSWCGFADAIVAGLRSRGMPIAVTNIAAISTKEYPTRAARPLNSRLNIMRFEKITNMQMPRWQDALDLELDELVTRAAS